MNYLNTFRTVKSLFNSRFYPLVAPEIDVRYRLPRKNLHKLKVLNVGVGSGYSGLARQLPFIEFGSLTMIDVHQPYLDMAKMKTWDARKIEFIKADLRSFDPSDFDVVMMFDVLEHVEKDDAIAFLSKIKGRSVVFGPLEKVYRPNVFEVKSQDHLSLWTEQDFIDLGFNTELLKNFHREEDQIFDAVWALK